MASTFLSMTVTEGLTPQETKNANGTCLAAGCRCAARRLAQTSAHVSYTTTTAVPPSMLAPSQGSGLFSRKPRRASKSAISEHDRQAAEHQFDMHTHLQLLQPCLVWEAYTAAQPWEILVFCVRHRLKVLALKPLTML